MICEKCGSSNNVPDSFTAASKVYLRKLVDEGAFMDISAIASKIAKFRGCGEIDIPTDITANNDLTPIRKSELSVLFENSKDVRKRPGRYYTEMSYSD